MNQLGGSLLQSVDPLLTHGFLLRLSLETSSLLRRMQLLLTLIKDDKRTFFEVLQEAFLHDICDLVKEASEVAMAVVVIQDPS